MKSVFKCLSSAVCLFTVSWAANNATTADVDVIDSVEIINEVPDYDFCVVVTGDSVYFNILDENSVALVYWGRSNYDNHILEIPGSVSHQGNVYEVVEIGQEAMGVGLNSGRELYSIWAEDNHGVERIILPTTVKSVGNAAFTSHLRSSNIVVELTDSIEFLGFDAVNCMSIHDEDYAIILPANIRIVEGLLDDEDHDGGEVIYSKLYIPEHLEVIDGLDGFGRNQPLFETVEVHPDNKHFRSLNGTLYSYDLDSIYWSTIHEDLYIPKNLRVDKNSIAFIEDGWYPLVQMPMLKTIVTEPGNPYCVAIDNVLYDINNRCMILAGGEEESTVHVPAWCNSVSVMSDTGYLMPKTYIFADDAPQADVDCFIHSLLETTGFMPFIFVYKGRTWSNEDE